MNDSDFDKRVVQIKLSSVGLEEKATLIDKLAEDVKKAGYCRECSSCGEVQLFEYKESYDEDILETEKGNYHRWYAGWTCQNEDTDCNSDSTIILTGHCPVD